MTDKPLSDMTVAELRKLANTLEIPNNSKSRKGQLINEINDWYQNKIQQRLAAHNKRYNGGKSAAPMTAQRRADNYRKSNGSNKFTPKQKRRINKKIIKHGDKILHVEGTVTT